MTTLTDWYFVTETQIVEWFDGEVRNVAHDFRATVKVAQRDVPGQSVQKLFDQRYWKWFSAAHP